MPNKAPFAAALVLSCAPSFSPAFAWEFTPYVFGSVGYSDSNMGMLEHKHQKIAQEARNNGGNARLDMDDRALTTNAGIGVQLHRYIALELSYYDLGSYDIEAEGSITRGMGTTSANGSAEVEVSGWGLQSVFIAPFTENLAGTLSLGVAGLKTEIEGHYIQRTDSPFGSSTETKRYDKTSREIVGNFGLGGRYDFNEDIAARLNYNYLGGVGRYETAGESKIHMLSAGLAYTF